MPRLIITLICCVLYSSCFAVVNQEGIRLKELCRVEGVRDNSLVGYGLVAGLSGTGDSIRSRATTQSIANTLKNLGLSVPVDDIASRNVAAVMVIATLPPFARPGDKLDVNVTSMGDAKSLLGGSLLLTHLKGANGKIYALAQGPISVGGYKYDLYGNVTQKNMTTAGNIPDGATVENTTESELVTPDGEIILKLHSPDFTTASRIKNSINAEFGAVSSRAIDAGRIAVKVPAGYVNDKISFMMQLEAIRINPDIKARVVVNERTGTVVSGGDVTISDVTITHGDLKVSITTDYLVSQPSYFNSGIAIGGRPNENIRTVVVPETKIDVVEEKPIALSLEGRTSVADLVATLNKIKTSSRDVITILQAIKRAGALHAELIIQ